MVDHDTSIDELLQAIQAVDDEGWDNPIRVIPPFAALLVKLSRQASETADKNILAQERLILLTNKLLWMTALVLAVSIALLIAAVVPLVR